MSSSIISLIIVAIIAGLAYLYNQLIILKERFKNAFSQIDIQLKRRYDLIPNLVATTKGYLQHENETLIKVTEARNIALAALNNASQNPDKISTISALNKAEKNLSTLLSGFNLQMESYPDLKASQPMQQLMEELSSTENRIAFARQAFNDAVMAYNIQRKSFPTIILANTFGHPRDASLLTFEDSQTVQKTPQITF